jgi:hypothetical protein
VKLAPILFNPADEVSLKMYLTGQGKIKGTARIIGGKFTEIDLSSQPTTIKLSKTLKSIVVATLLWIALMVGWILLFIY